MYARTSGVFMQWVRNLQPPNGGSGNGKKLDQRVAELTAKFDQIMEETEDKSNQQDERFDQLNKTIDQLKKAIHQQPYTIKMEMKETMRRETKSIEAKCILQMRSVCAMHRQNLLDYGVEIFIHGTKAQRSKGCQPGQEVEYYAWVETLTSPVEFIVDDEVGKRVVAAAPSLLLRLACVEKGGIGRDVLPVSSSRDYAFSIKNMKSCEDMIFAVEFYMELFECMFGLTVDECLDCDEEIWDLPLVWFLKKPKQRTLRLRTVWRSDT